MNRGFSFFRGVNQGITTVSIIVGERNEKEKKMKNLSIGTFVIIV